MNLGLIGINRRLSVLPLVVLGCARKKIAYGTHRKAQPHKTKAVPSATVRNSPIHILHSNNVTRLSEAAACYTGALRASPRPPDRRQRCHLRLALCTVNASEIARKARMRGGGGGNQLSSSREQQQRVEAECFAALLLDEKGECSEAVDEIVQEAHISVGVFRLCEEWDVGGALNHFLMATVNQRRVGSLVGEEDEEEENRSVPQGGDVGWGAVWLAQVGALKITQSRA